MTIVSDHAVLRFLERECGLDVESLRGAIAAVTERGSALGAPIVKVGGARFVLVDGVVVTVLVHGRRPRLAQLKQAMKGGRCHE